MSSGFAGSSTMTQPTLANFLLGFGSLTERYLNPSMSSSNYKLAVKAGGVVRLQVACERLLC